MNRAERIISGILKEVSTDVCIEYTPVNCFGYGDIQTDEDGKHRHYLAHRVSYELHNICKLEPSDIIMHTCDNRACINPKHLVKGTHNDNVQDKVNKGRQAKGITNGRYRHGYFSKYAPVEKPKPDFQSIGNRSLTLQQVKDIKNAIKNRDNKTLRVIAEEFNVKYQTVRDISRGKVYKAF